MGDEQVVKSGAGKKGDPYRFKKLRAEAAQSPAQQARTNGNAGASAVSAQPPLGDAQNKEATAADSSPPSRCAETTGATDAAVLDADAELARITAKFGTGGSAE